MAAAPGDTPVIYGSAAGAAGARAASAGADGRGGDGMDPADSDASWRAARVDRDTALPLVSPVQSYAAFFQATPDLFFCRCVMKVNKNQKRQKRLIVVKRGHIVVIDPSKSVIRRYLPVANVAAMRRRRISGQGDGGEGTVWQCLLVVPAEFDLLLNFSRDDSNLPLDPGRRPEHFFHVLRTLHDRMPPPKSMHFDVVVPSTEDLFRQANFEKPEGYQSPLPRLEEMERIIRSRSLQPGGGGSGATPLQPPQAGREASLSSLSAPSERPRSFDPAPHTLAGWRRGSASPAVSSPQSSPKRSREGKSPKRGRSIDAGSGVPREELTRILEEKVQDWNHAIEDENVQLKLKMLELSETVNQLSHKNASAESEVAELRDVVGKLTEELLRARERQVGDGTPCSTDGNGVAAGTTPPATQPVSTAAAAARTTAAGTSTSPPPTPPLPPVLPNAASQQRSGSGRGGSAAATPPLGPSTAPAAAAAAAAGSGSGTTARKDFIYPPDEGPLPRVGSSGAVTPSFASPASPPDGGVYFAGDLYQKVLPAGGSSVPCSPAVAAAKPPRAPRPLGELPHCLTGEEVRALARQSIRYVECLQHASLADLREVLPPPAVRKLLAATGYKPGSTPEAPLVEAGAGVLGGAGSVFFPSAGVAAGLHARAAPPAAAALPAAAAAVTGKSGSGVVEDNANLRAMVDFLRSQIVYLDCVQQGTAEGEAGGSSGAAAAVKPLSIVRKL